MCAMFFPYFLFRFGPLVCHCTVCFEAKHSYFTQLARSMGHFINISYSLSMRRQLYQCYINIDKRPPTRLGTQLGMWSRLGFVNYTCSFVI